MKKNFSLLLLMCIFVVLLSSCGGRKASERPLRIAVTAYPVDVLAYVAKEKGFFDKHGVSVELVFFKEMHEARRSFELGKIDGIFDVIQDEIKRQSQGFASKIVFIEDVSSSGDAIISVKEISSIKDLKGKTVGIDAPYSSSHVFVRKALSAGGLADWEVFIKKIDATDVISALENGDVVAAHTWEPTLSRALKKGYKRLVNAGDYPYFITDIIAFSSEAIKNRPNEIRAFLKAYMAAQQYLFSNSSDAIKIISKYAGAPEADIETAFKGVQLGDIALNEELMVNGNSKFYDAIIRMTDFYDNHGLISKRLLPSELFDATIIRDIK